MHKQDSWFFYPRLLLLLHCLMFTHPVFADTLSIHTVPLQHRTAEFLMPHLSPLIIEGGSISAYGNKLIINTSPENFAQLRSLIDELDQPLKQFLLSVSNKLYFPPQRENHNAAEQAYHRRTTGNLKAQQQPSLQVLEGHSAYLIKQPDSQQFVVIGERDEHHFKTLVTQRNTELLVATPWLHGKNVTINLEHTFNYQQQQVQTHSTVSGKLGQWITIVDLDSKPESPLGDIDTKSVKRRHGVFIKLEMVDHTTQ